MRADAGIVISREAEGRRFVADTPWDQATLRDMEAAEQIGRPNLFVPE